VVNETPAPEGLPDVDTFFVESAEHSKLKTTIATKYFFTWARIIMRTERSPRIGYVDLYAGPGRFVDGTKSTPLLILERTIRDPRMREKLVTYFNDGKPAHANSLEASINALPGLGTLTYAPKIDKHQVGPRTVAAFEKPHIPTFAFIDPYGYKGLSLGLVNAIIKDWACECLFFFNYNRINPGINNSSVTRHMEALFGVERLAALRGKVRDVTPAQRERLVMEALTEALQELGGKYVVYFRFKMEDIDRTSHYLVFVSKKFLGYKIMRDVMGEESSSSVQGVPSFEYDPHVQSIFEFAQDKPLDDLMDSLAVDLAGRVLTVESVPEVHTPKRPYLSKNYREALLRLEAADRLKMDPPAKDRRPYKEGRSLPKKVRVMFPRQPGTGARIAASRSTPDRPASALPPSASARPTA